MISNKLDKIKHRNDGNSAYLYKKSNFGKLSMINSVDGNKKYFYAQHFGTHEICASIGGYIVQCQD